MDRSINYPAIHEFEVGVVGEPTPTLQTISKASTLVQIIENAAQVMELSVDVDGALSFVFTLQDNTLVMGEFTMSGDLYAWRYDKSDWSTQTDIINEETDVTVMRRFL